jgi:hypothetical protein
MGKNIIFQHPVAFIYSLHSILQSLMQLLVHQFLSSTSVKTDVLKVALKTVIIECKNG